MRYLETASKLLLNLFFGEVKRMDRCLEEVITVGRIVDRSVQEVVAGRKRWRKGAVVEYLRHGFGSGFFRFWG